MSEIRAMRRVSVSVAMRRVRVRPAGRGPRGGRCRCGGDAAHPPAGRAHRARRGGRDSLLQPCPARPGRGLSRPPAAARRWPGWRSAASRWSLLALRLPRERLRGRAPGPAARPRPVPGISLVLVAGEPAARRHSPRPRGRRRALHPGLGPVAGGRREVGRHRRGRSPPAAPRAGVGLWRRFGRRWWIPRLGRRRGRGRGVRLRLAGRDRPALQRLRRAAGRRAALRRARAGRARGRGRGRGLPGRRQPPDDRRERLRDRARPHEARGALRQPDRRLHAGRGALGGGPRARPREVRRRAARAALPGADRAARDVPRAAHDRAARAGRARRGPRAGARAGARRRLVRRPDRRAATSRAGSRRAPTRSRCG